MYLLLKQIWIKYCTAYIKRLEDTGKANQKLKFEAKRFLVFKRENLIFSQTAYLFFTVTMLLGVVLKGQRFLLLVDFLIMCQKLSLHV